MPCVVSHQRICICPMSQNIVSILFWGSEKIDPCFLGKKTRFHAYLPLKAIYWLMPSLERRLGKRRIFNPHKLSFEWGRLAMYPTLEYDEETLGRYYQHGAQKEIRTWVVILNWWKEWRKRWQTVIDCFMLPGTVFLSEVFEFLDGFKSKKTVIPDCNPFCEAA